MHSGWRRAVQSGATVAVPLYVATGPIRGMLRACNFWVRAFPLFLRYKWAEWRINTEEQADEARECRWERLHAQYAPHLLRHILELRGYFIKVGQFASSRNDFMPARIIEELSKLQGDVPGMPASQVRRVIERDMGVPLDSVFSEFDMTPLGAAR